jgi:hypothetical protein
MVFRNHHVGTAALRNPLALERRSRADQAICSFYFQLVRENHHSRFEGFARLVWLLLQPWTANDRRNARQIAFLLGRGVDKDMEDRAYATWTHLTKPSLSD